MKLWPFGRTEVRSSYSDVITEALLNAAAGEVLATNASAAVVAVAGLMGRSFASAAIEASPRAAALTPSLLGDLGYSLILRGGAVYLIELDGANVDLLPCSDWEVKGGPNPRSWRYRVTLDTPSGDAQVRTVPAAGVVHIRAPGASIQSAHGFATVAKTLAARVESKLAEELRLPTGAIMPYYGVKSDQPDVTDQELIDKLTQKLSTMRGGFAFLTSMQSNRNMDATAVSNRADWRAVRVGADPPETLVNLHRQAAEMVQAAYGVNPALLSSEGDASGKREAYRQFLHTLVSPLGRVAGAELSAKLETDVRLDFRELNAADIASKARAANSLVSAGASLDDALRLAGLS